MYLGIGINQAIPYNAAFSLASLFASGEEGALYDPSDPSTLFADTDGNTAASGIGGDVSRMNDLSGNDVPATSATAWLLRRDATYSVQRNGGTFSVTLPDMGNDATLAYVDGDGVTITTGLTIGSGSYDLPTSDRLGPVIVIDRALDPGETSRLTNWLTVRRPGNWLLGLGTWDDSGEWNDAAFWQTVA